MSDQHEKHQHHHHGLHHHKEEPTNYAYGQSAAPPPGGYPAESVSSSTVAQDSQAEAEKRAALEKAQKRNEHLAEFGALASGAFAMYEQHRTKVDPENAQRHRIEEGVAGVAALASGGVAVYEHHTIKTTHKADLAASSDKQKDSV